MELLINFVSLTVAPFILGLYIGWNKGKECQKSKTELWKAEMRKRYLEIRDAK